MAPNEERYQEETRRLVGLLLAEAKRKGKSLRSLEMKLGVGLSYLTKVANGTVNAYVKHLLMLCDALDLPWAELYAMACKEKMEEQAAEEERRMLEVLYKYGVLPRPASPSAAGSEEK